MDINLSIALKFTWNLYCETNYVSGKKQIMFQEKKPEWQQVFSIKRNNIALKQLYSKTCKVSF